VDWTQYRKTKEAANLHPLLDHEGLLSHCTMTTDCKQSDIEVTRNLDLPTDRMLVAC
jgi:hypothetical protein